MTDRELLELAAKASGFDVSHFDRDKKAMVVFAIDGDENPDQDYWNPLTNDGDALRLAVKLGMNVTISESFMASAWCDGLCQGYGYDFDGDPYAATRRSIVRAAAEIGLSMK